MVKSSCLGLPRIGESGQLCTLVQNVVKNGLRDFSGIQEVGMKIRKDNWLMLQNIGIDIIPCNDFSIYDHVLDTTLLVGNIPRRYYWEGGVVPLEIYFSMIKGQQKEKFDVKGMSMQQWFNTKYFSMVPEFSDPISFAYSDNKAIAHFLEAKAMNINTRPVLLGPVTYVLMGFIAEEDGDDLRKVDIVEEIVQVYEEIFNNFRRLKITDVFFDESFLIKDLTQEEQAMYRKCYSVLHELAKGDINLHVGVSYGTIGSNLECLMSLQPKSIHIDVTNGRNNVDEIVGLLPKDTDLSLGLVDACGLYINNLSGSIRIAEHVASKIGGDRTIIAPSSSLFLAPLDVEKESFKHANADFYSFAKQKMQEVKVITDALNLGFDSVATQVAKNEKLIKKLSAESASLSNFLKNELQGFSGECVREDFKTRKALLAKKYELPVMPMVDVGSMPSELCTSRSIEDIGADLKDAIKRAAVLQEQFLDVVSSGELERSSNHEYFASMFDGIELSSGVVQTSGDSFSRVPFLFGKPKEGGDHYVKVAKYSKSCTELPLKFTIMGPVSMVNCLEIEPSVDKFLLYMYFSKVISAQIQKLELVGIDFITLDESFFLVHMSSKSDAAVQQCKNLSKILKGSFGRAKDDTQVSVYMRNIPFEEFIEYFQFDADLLLIESSQSNFAVLEYFVSYKYSNDIGIGLFNPDSVRIPTKPEIYHGIKKSSRVLDEFQMWIVCDSGFKKRSVKDFKKIWANTSSATKEIRKSV